MKTLGVVLLFTLVSHSLGSQDGLEQTTEGSKDPEFQPITFERALNLEFPSTSKIFRRTIAAVDTNLRLNLVLEYMNCDPAKNSYLSIKGDNNITYNWCTKVNYRSSDFSGTKFVAETSNRFEIELHTDSEEITAIFTVTAFQEKDGCTSKEFYCGKKNGTPRCIAKGLECDDHPNCGGMTTNEDERCCGGVYFRGYSCDWYHWSYIWAAFFALVFVTIIPAIVVVTLCFYRGKRTRRRVNRRHDVPTRELPNDHPPTYDDVRTTEVPPPCFCSVTNVTKPDDKKKEETENRKCECTV